MNKIIFTPLLLLISAQLFSTTNSLTLKDLSEVNLNNFEEPVLIQDVNQREYEDENSVVEEEVGEDVKNCFMKILGPSVTCIVKSLGYWRVSSYELKTATNSRTTCCAIWEMTDCLLNQAKLYCSPSGELTSFKLHMDDLTRKRNARNCTEIPSYSNTCNTVGRTEQDESRNPVFTNTLFRGQSDPERFSNDDELAREPIVKRRHYNVEGLENGVAQAKREQKHEDIENDEQDFSNMLDDLPLAKRLLDRVDRITVNQIVIDLHPVHKHVETKQSLSAENNIDINENLLSDEQQ